MLTTFDSTKKLSWKEQQFDALEERSANTLKVGTPNIKGLKYNGDPYRKFKKLKT